MSNRAIHWALKQKGVKTTPKFVLFVLADLADEKDSCWPSQTYIADAINASERTVRDALRALEEAGLIETTARYQDDVRTSNRYVLLL